MNRISAVVVFYLSCLAAAPLMAQPFIGGSDWNCDSSTLNGTYQLFMGGRQVTSAGAISKTFQATGTAVFDGQSKVTFTMTANTNTAAGTPLVYSGTYSFQTNCVGSINMTSGTTGTFTLEAYGSGNSFGLNGSDATYSYNGSGNIQPAAGCQTSTLSGVHEFNGSGLTLSSASVTGIIDTAGVLQFDGQGNMTANWTQSSNTSTTTVSAMGTYSVSSGCLGSATLTDASNNKYSVNLSLFTTVADFSYTFASPGVQFGGYGSVAQSAAAAAATCGASTLNGGYEFQLGGRLVTAAGVATKVLHGVGTATFDGQGKVSVNITANTNGAAGALLTYSGTYSLQSNCQGSINITSGDTATLALVAYSMDPSTSVARAFVLVGADATYAYTGGGNTPPAACAVATLSGPWTFNGTGSTLSGSSVNGTDDVAGVLQFDGQGNATAAWTEATNTATTSFTATGTYSMTSPCIFSASLTDNMNTKSAWTMSAFGATAASFVYEVAKPQTLFTGNGRAAFVNPGLAVVNGASDAPGFTPPGSVFTVFGANVATGVAQPSMIPLPTMALTTSVTVNGEAAPIFYVNQTQVNAQMPEDIQPGLATVIVKNGSATSNAVAAMVPATGTPGISVYGQNHAVVVNQNGSVNSSSAPAKVGDVVVIYFTGGGPVQGGGKLVTGALTPAGLFPVTGTSSVTVNGKPATVDYIGLVPTTGIGLYQANIHVPQVAAGDHPLVITINGQASNRPLISVAN